jgi:hypothetical protein
MKTQTDTPECYTNDEAIRDDSHEVFRDHPEIERVELLAMLTHDEFKDAITMCAISSKESDKASAFAVYGDRDSTTISEPVLEEPDQVCHFGLDKTNAWGIDTKVDEFMDPTSAKYRQLFMEPDGFTPRTDVKGFFIVYPVADLVSKGFDAKKIRRPKKDLLNFFADRTTEQPGFITGVISNDGVKSGLLLFKNGQDNPPVNRAQFGNIGSGDEIGREMVLGMMSSAGIVYADIDLRCPSGSDPSKLYNKRIVSAIDELF